MKLNYNVRLILRTEKERKTDGTCPVYIEITLNGKRFVKFSTGERGKRKGWDLPTQSFVGKGFGLLNKTLKNMVFDLENYIADMKSRGEFVSAEMLRSYYRKEDTQCYFRYFDDTFTKSRLKGLEKATIDKYKILRRDLKTFRPRLRLCEIDLKFLHDFRNFLIYGNNLGDGGRWNREKNFRATVKLAFDLGLINQYPFRNFKLDKPKSKNEALTIAEVDKIVKVDLKGNKPLEETREKFLFACYTGLRTSDMRKLKWEEIQRGILKTVQKKTKKPVNVPLNKQARKY